MAAPDFVHIEGFDKYGPVGQNLLNALNANLWADEWTSISGGAFAQIITPMNGPVTGHGACRLKVTNSGNSPVTMKKNLPGNYARCIGGFTTQIPDVVSQGGILFYDGATVQLSINLNCATGHIELRRGGFAATLIAATTESFVAGSTYVIEYDITFHNSAGIAKIWLNGVLTSINLTAQDLCATANNYINVYGPANTNSNNHVLVVDHMYHWFWLAAGGSETPCLDNPIIETSTASGDDATAWTVGPHAFATPMYYWGSAGLTLTPGAGQLYLTRVVADAAGDISNLVIPKPNTTSATAKHKAVIYADTSSAPGALLATGTEVVGTTSGTALVLPVALAGIVAGTHYWVGFICDTAVNFGCNDEGGTSYGKANTYASGPPTPAGAGFTTNKLNINMILTMTGVAAHYPQANASPPLGDYSYNYSSTLNQQEVYSFPALSSAPIAIHGVAVKAHAARSDAGVRALKLLAKSSGSSSYGSSGDITPPSTYGMEGSNFDVDPHTGLPWGAGALAAATFGVEVTV